MRQNILLLCLSFLAFTVTAAPRGAGMAVVTRQSGRPVGAPAPGVPGPTMRTGDDTLVTAPMVSPTNKPSTMRKTTRTQPPAKTKSISRSRTSHITRKPTPTGQPGQPGQPQQPDQQPWQPPQIPDLTPLIPPPAGEQPPPEGAPAGQAPLQRRADMDFETLDARDAEPLADMDFETLDARDAEPLAFDMDFETLDARGAEPVAAEMDLDELVEAREASPPPGTSNRPRPRPKCYVPRGLSRREAEPLRRVCLRQ